MPNVKLNKNKHVISINFDAIEKTENRHYQRSASLTRAKQWDDVPSFVVLTGRNGVGKSHLLSYLDVSLYEMEVNLVKRNADYQSMNSYSDNGRAVNHNYLNDPEMETIFVWDILNNLAIQNTGQPLTEDMLKGISDSTQQKYYRHDSFFKKVIAILNSQYSQDQIDEAAVRKAIKTTVVYEIPINQLEAPLGVLQKVLIGFFNQQSELIKHYKKSAQAPELFKEYLKKQNVEESLEGHQAFMRLLSDHKQYHDFIVSYVAEIQGISPLDEFNQTLDKINFGYKISLQEASNNSSSFELILQKKDGSSVRQLELSSGEKTILDVMSWQYCFENMGVDGKQVVEKVDVMLLDEPDKHLDPRSCKTLYKLLDVFVSKGIQVIMTTHRTDTIALARDKTIFAMEKTEEGTVVINPCTKLKAMFRLTPNFRELTNFSIKVYTEAHDDTVLYEAVYRLLSQYCDEARDDNARDEQPRHNRFTWKLLNDCGIAEPRVLSRRYQLAFHSTGPKKKQIEGKDISGGTVAVKIAVARDYYSHQLHKKKLNQRRFFIDPAMEYPFGIVDKDLQMTSKRKPVKKDEIDEETLLKDRIITLKRHSIENYLCDPFILCSVLSKQHMQIFADNAFRQICLDIKTNIYQSDKQVLLKEKIKQYFEFLIEKILKLHPNLFPNPDQLLPSELKQSLREMKEKRFVILSADKSLIEIEYPYAFLYCQGHALAEIIKKLSIENLQEQLIDGLASADSFCIPVDLIETMLELDKKVREQVRKVNDSPQNRLPENAAAAAAASAPDEFPVQFKHG